MDYTNKALGLRVQTQIPLNIKEYAGSELLLKDLGLNNNLAFTYHKNLKVTCLKEGTNWEWLEVLPGQENTGLLITDFIYPSNIIAFGVNYSNKKYNFFPIQVDGNQDNFVRSLIINVNNLPSNYTEQDICDYILSLPKIERTIAETDSKWNIIIEDSPS
jgi:hypothetical protein